jgi:hypothetical protein
MIFVSVASKQLSAPVSPLDATLTKRLASVDSKRLKLTYCRHHGSRPKARKIALAKFFTKAPKEKCGNRVAAPPRLPEWNQRKV